jgi:FdhE protein
MPGTAGRVRTDTASRLAGLERDRPEWKTWLALLAQVERELHDATPAPLSQPVARPALVGRPGTHLLAGQPLEVDPAWLQGLVHRLAAAAGGSLQEYLPDRTEAVRLLDAAVQQDETELAAIAAAAGVDAGSLGSVANLAAVPVLHAWGRLLQDQVPVGWPHGYCPICGAWPILAERRGLDRTRWLRCGRCAGAWEVQPLWCTYCGERDHRKLGSLVLEGEGDMLKVETCDNCRGYLKSLATLQAIPPFELLLRDLETVELDLVAVERGYGRPEPVTSRESRGHESRVKDHGS